MLKKSLLTALAIVVVSHVAFAQPTDFGVARSSRPIRILLGGGASVPVGEFADRYDPGYTIHGSLLIRLGSFPINLRTDVNYSRLKLKDLFSPTGETAFADDATKMLGGLLNLTLPLGTGPVRFYVMAGVGAINVDPAQFSSTSPESSVEFAINGGGGLQLRLFGLEAFVEARINNVYTERGIVDTKGISMIPVTFGVIF
ncbi:MAG TPA: hypothetical protein VJ717_12050 [Gemmatimonadaceae bacterium]|nr:hypothetical protein [Gemmatimonadaceae bacterium]